MPVYRISELDERTPPWNVFSRGETLHLGEGSVLPAHFSDAFNFYFVVEGRATALEGDTTRGIAAGEVLVVPPGVWHGIEDVQGTLTLLHLTGPACPPFRRGRLGAEASPTTLAFPFQAPPSAGRFGVSISFDETKTFSPMMLGSSMGGDLVLTLNIGAIVRNQAEEIRRHCLSNRRALAALILRMINDREIEEFPLHSSKRFLVSMLRPANLGIQANLVTDAGRQRARILLDHWRQPLEIEAIRPCVRMPAREWSDMELADLFEFLNGVSPAHFGVILQMLNGGIMTSAGPVRYLEALLPWLVGVECRDPETMAELRQVLDPLGYQGWLLKTL